MDSILDYYLTVPAKFKSKPVGDRGDTLYYIGVANFFDFIRIKNGIRTHPLISEEKQDYFVRKSVVIFDRYFMSIGYIRKSLNIKYVNCYSKKTGVSYYETNYRLFLGRVWKVREKTKYISCCYYENESVFWNEFVAHKNNFYYVVPDE
jgi:hypothetical protein